jgi:hypothetical protein
MNIVVSIIGVINHIARLRSWREKRRTAGFCAAYFIAWAFDFVVPLLTATLIALITHPPSREFLFPPAPIALVDKNTGGVQKPAAGVLGSHDSATGAPENHKGEAVEKEASTFVDGIAKVAVSSATGKYFRHNRFLERCTQLTPCVKLLEMSPTSPTRTTGPRSRWRQSCGPR